MGEEIQVLCYFKELTLPIKWYSVIWKCSWVCCKHILKILRQPPKKKKKKPKKKKEKREEEENWYAKKGKKMELYKMLN
jgi:hypothetical protein